MYLCDMEVGNKAIIKKMTANNSIKRRLQDLGLIEGTVVECDLIRGALIAIRKEDCSNIEVEII